MKTGDLLLPLWHVRRFGTWATIATSLALSLPRASPAQAPAANVSLGFGIDTSITEVRDIVRLTRAYLTRPDSTARASGLWSTQSAFDERIGDPAMSAYQGFSATIIGVTGTGHDDSVFVVKVLHAAADSAGKRISPLALQRFYAIRASGSPYGWQLASPLSRLTRDWTRRDYGRITFWYAPGQRQSPEKARLASLFMDSVARLFSVAPPSHLDVYMTASTDEGQRLLGLDFFPDGSGPGTGLGGRTNTQAGILFLGDPRVGEAYLHEFVHAVLGPTLPHGSAIFNEGVAVWLAGSHEKSLKTMSALLRTYQSTHPQVSMAEVLNGAAPGGQDATNALYTTSGLIVDSIYRQSGISGVRRFAQVRGSPDDIVKALPNYINGIGGDINQWWRTETEAVAKR